MRRVLLTICILWFAFSAKAQSIGVSDVGNLMPERLKELTNIETTINKDGVIVSTYTDPQTGLQFINLKQSYKNIRVLNAVQTMVFRKETLQSSVSSFIQNIEIKAPAAEPSVVAPDAIAKAAMHLGLSLPVNMIPIEDRFTKDKKIIFSPAGISKQNIEAELVWLSDDDSAVHLAWSIIIDVKNSADHWNVKIDAHTGGVINKSNYTQYDNFQLKKDENMVQRSLHGNTQKEIPSIAESFLTLAPPPPTVASASYQVIPFPLENRFAGNISVDTDPWKKAGPANNATTHGWHFDGINNYNYTRGNNVYAYDDSLAINTPGRSDTSSAIGNTLTFNNTPNFTLQPTARANRLFATDNLFYWNNIMHDVFYQYGFDEQSGNFQKDNMGRAPGAVSAAAIAGSDPVQAQAQDGGGHNNANFSTPPDGQSPRMQMYLFSATNSNILSVSAPLSLKGMYTSVESAFSSQNKLIKKGPCYRRPGII
jgi:extracellular elastinolytic metalloproteinase